MIHSTRGGAINDTNEFNATIGWFAFTASDVSAHSVAGLGVLARCVDPRNTAYHARTWNDTHLGIELVQPRLGEVVDPTILDAAAWECANWVKMYNIPLQWDQNNGFIEHWQIPPGVADGKTDIEPPFDRDDFLKRVDYYLSLMG